MMFNQIGTSRLPGRKPERTGSKGKDSMNHHPPRRIANQILPRTFEILFQNPVTAAGEQRVPAESPRMTKGPANDGADDDDADALRMAVLQRDVPEWDVRVEIVVGAEEGLSLSLSLEIDHALSDHARWFKIRTEKW